MNRFDHQWQKLTALARQAGDDRTVTAPYGFATRVVARASLAPVVPAWAPFERFALRGLLVAAAFGVGAIAFSYANLQGDTADEYAATDTVGDLLDIS